MRLNAYCVANTTLLIHTNILDGKPRFLVLETEV